MQIQIHCSQSYGYFPDAVKALEKKKTYKR